MINFVINLVVNSVNFSPASSPFKAHSSRGLGHFPLKEEITGSNPVCATKPINLP